MKITLAIFWGILSSTSYAAILESGEHRVETSIPYVLAELEAKCQSPRFEDEGFRTYFSDASYREISALLNEGYSFKLVDYKCGDGGNLPTDRFVPVKVILYNVRVAQEKLDEELRKVID